MFYHVKELQFNARVFGPDPRFASMLLEQFGGPNGELKAAMQYFVQSFAARQPYPDKYDMLMDIATEEFSHLEIVGATTLIMRHTSGPAVIVVGYRPYPALREALARIAPALAPTQPVSDLIAYVTFWQIVTAGEIAVAYDLDLAAATHMLDEAVARGMLIREGQLYRSQGAPLELARGA